MKFINRPQRRRTSRTGQNISMFPFLAVLICTMGALVPLLLVITRTVRLQAQAAALAKHDEAKHTRREDARWRIEQLTRSRDQTAAQLAEARLELGHIEDHARRLRTQIIQYEQAAQELDRMESTGQRQVAATQAELEQLRRQIDAAERELAEARQAAAERNRSYAVVPYEGPNQTHRRPVYIECLANSIVLQPEGIVFTEADFEGPLGPGNPLAAALRAAREYLLAQREFDPQAGEPYPMLLVRPEGIAAFYVARVAMKSWGSDFGYELVDADWKIAYQAPDPRLAEAVRQSVASARAYQQRLIASAPREYGRPKTVYRASSSGGFVREGGSQGPGGRGRGSGFGGQGSESDGGSETGGQTYNPYVTSPERSTNAVAGGNQGSGVRDQGSGSDGGSGDGSTEYNPSIASSQSPTTAVVGGNLGPGGRDQGSGVGGQGSGSAGGSGGGSEASNPSIVSSQSPSTAFVGGNPGAGTERPEGYVAGQPPRDQQSAQGAHGHPLRPGEWEPRPNAPSAGQQKPDDKNNNPPARPQALAVTRGQDWGLRETGLGSVGLTRPMQVQCYADRLIVISDRGPHDNRTVRLGPRTASAVDPLMAAVWDQMDAWGMAGRGMYWKPVLQLHVAPDAERRFIELAALLEGSGLTVIRR